LAQMPAAKNVETNDGADAMIDLTSSSHMIGLAAVLCAASTSGFAGVYTEKLLKDTRDSLWVRNAQLATFGIVLGLVLGFIQNGASIMEHGFFQGFTLLTWVVVFNCALGGLLVAVVLKYADNILKCFASAFSLLLTYAMEKMIDPTARGSPYFAGGALCVVLAVTMYSLFPPKTPVVASQEVEVLTQQNPHAKLNRTDSACDMTSEVESEDEESEEGVLV